MKLSIYPVVLFAAVACISAGAGRTQADDTQVVVDGVGVFPLDEQTWRSPVMAYPQRVTDADSLRQALTDWWSPSEAPRVLEIATPPEVSAEAYRAYMAAVSA